MKTRHKILTVAAGLAGAAAVLAAVAVRMPPAGVQNATIVAQSAVGAAFTSGIVAAFSGPAARGIDARRSSTGSGAAAEEAPADSELLRLKQE